MGSLIGILAIATLLLVLFFGIWHFSSFLRDPANRSHAKNTLVDDGKSATTEASEGQHGRAHAGSTLKERLDRSIASAHPDDPERS